MMRIIFFIIYALFVTQSLYAAVYLDGSATSCTSGATTYSPGTRSCGDGSDTVYLTLAAFESGIVAEATNYIRAGDYLRDSSMGTLRIGSTKSGSSNSARTIISAYPGEGREVILATETRGKTYNSDPWDATGVGSHAYYPNVVLSITGASYVTVRGIKTFGQVFVWGNSHDITLDSCDFGGGGPADYQGNVVKFSSGYNYLVVNSAIHDSCMAENIENGASIIGYDSHFDVKSSTIYDSFGPDIFIKDTGGKEGFVAHIDGCFFGKSSLNTANTGGGIRGHNQDVGIDGTIISNNIFTQNGYNTLLSDNATVINNTFVDCFLVQAHSASGATPLIFENNIVFSSELIFSITAKDYLTEIQSDNNIFYGGGIWQKSAPNATTWATTLSGWKTFSSLDANSITSNPQFVSATGTTPEDFKRVAYAENFTGSTYGTKAGAYITGDEQIGADWLSGEPVTPPIDPTPTPTTSGPLLNTGSGLLKMGNGVLRVQ